jgi:hypothetical protein
MKIRMPAIKHEGRIYIGSSYESILKWKYDCGYIEGGVRGFIDDTGKFINKENAELIQNSYCLDEGESESDNKSADLGKKKRLKVVKVKYDTRRSKK